jgi:DNA-binding XRE family transcriptional regulator
MSVLCERDYTNYKKVDENEYYYNIENNVEILNKYKNEFMLYIKIKKFFLDSIDDLFNFTNYIYSNDKYINLNAIKFVKFNSL